MATCYLIKIKNNMWLSCQMWTKKLENLERVIATVQERNNKLLVQDADDQDVDK